MKDSAEEVAAQIAWDAIIARGGRGPNANPWLNTIEGAAEALRPIRELYKDLTGERPGVAFGSGYAEGMDFVLSELEPLIFPERAVPGQDK